MEESLYDSPQKLRNQTMFGHFLFMVKANSESLSLFPPLPRATKPKATTPEQDVYFLESPWIPAVCFPPEITREQTHGKGKRRHLVIPCLTHRQCFSSALYLYPQWAAVMSQFVISKPKPVYFFSFQSYKVWLHSLFNREEQSRVSLKSPIK